jgi:hypothetical protein
MKKLTILIAALLMSLGVQAQVFYTDSFTYPDGSIVANSGGNWLAHSGTTADSVVSNGKLIVSGSATADIGRTFTQVPSVMFASFTVNFSSLPSINNGTYFAHFKDTNIAFRARIYAQTNGIAVPGTFRLGISGGGAVADQVYPQDLALNTDYRVVVRYAADPDLYATLWVNPVVAADQNVASTDIITNAVMTAFAFRQATGEGVMTIDNLTVGGTFADVNAGAAAAVPTIIQGPQPTNVYAGDNVAFGVVATGTGALSYQWLKGSTPVGSNLPTLTLSNVGGADTDVYSVVVTDSAGSTPSAGAQLTVNTTPTKPIITTQPKNTSALVSSSPVLSVVATGTKPITYKWFFNDNEIPNETSTTLTLTSVKTNQSGPYYALLNNSAGSTKSDVISLTVTNPVIVSTNIAYLRSKIDPTTFGLTDTTTLYSVEGVVISYTNLTTGNANALFYMQDSTAGIAVFYRGITATNGFFTNSVNLNGIPLAGDRVRVTAPLTIFNGLLEVNYTNGVAGHSVELISKTNALPPATYLDFNATPAQLEALEGSFVVVSNVTISGTGNFTATTYNMTSGTLPTFQLFINSGSGLVGKANPGSAYTVKGVLGQFDSTTPFNSSYQLIPSKPSDIITIPPIIAKFVATGSGGSLKWNALPGTNYNIYASDTATGKFGTPIATGLTFPDTNGIYQLNTLPSVSQFFEVYIP